MSDVEKFGILIGLSVLYMMLVVLIGISVGFIVGIASMVEKAFPV